MPASPSLCPPDVRSRPHAGAARLTIVALGLVGLVGGFPRRGVAQAEDLTGRVVDKAGIGVSGARVWAIGGDGEAPTTVATATTDGRGRFVFPRAWEPAGPQPSRFLNVFARVGDGRIGWRSSIWWNYTHEGELTIVLGPVGPIRGRLNDQEGRPIAGAEVVPVNISRPAEEHPGQDPIRLSPELAGPFRTRTAADGSFAIGGTPPGCRVDATIVASGFGKPTISWDADRPASIVLDGRLGRVAGRLKPSDAGGLPRSVPVSLRRKTSPQDRDSGPFQMYYFQTVSTDPEGAFRFDDVPPGRYEILPGRGQGPSFDIQEVEVGPKAVVTAGASVPRFLSITGRILDAQTGKGIAGVGLHSTLLSPQNSLQSVGQAETDAEGRYTIGAWPGKVQVQPGRVPKTYLELHTNECPRLEVAADRTWPDLKLRRATELDGVVVNAAGQPAVGASVVLTIPGARGFASGRAPIRTGPDGTFHLDQLDPDDTLPIRARTHEATTDGTIVVRPGAVKGKLTLTIDPKFAFRVRGRVTDRSGQRIAGAKVRLVWQRSFVSAKPDALGKSIRGGLESTTTSESGWFVFRALWPGDRYQVVVEAPGRTKAEAPEVTGKAGETHDFGTIVLTGVEGHLAGRVTGSDGRPIAGATVFNRGDGPRPVEATTDDQGRFRLESLFPGTKYAFVRMDGHRFTGMKADGDADDLAITLLKTTEPPPAWQPVAPSSFEDQRAFARRILIRLWDKFGKDG